MRGADLYRTNLSEVDLRGTDLRGVDLREADLDKADLDGVKYNERTRWPQGLVHYFTRALLED